MFEAGAEEVLKELGILMARVVDIYLHQIPFPIT